jgi:hypothetical protein
VLDETKELLQDKLKADAIFEEKIKAEQEAEKPQQDQEKKNDENE